jgi:acetyl esterase/lipase
MNKFIKILLPIVAINFIAVSGQEYRLDLYKGPAPNSIPSKIIEKVEKRDFTWITNVQVPDIAVYLPTKRFATGQAVVICPGGGYGGLAYDLEGSEIARFLNTFGVAGVVLKYRLPSKETSIEPQKTPLLDAQRAMRLVRYNAGKWNIDPSKIGIMGFSAGGHLASTLGTHFDYGNKTAADSVEQQSCRPDFMILGYPVISFADSITHKGSKRALIGENPDKELIKYYSNELQVSDDTPPAFLVHANNDTGVPVENSLLMYEALHRKKIPAEIHILTEGGHGFGLGVNNQHVGSWTQNLKSWIISLNSKK